MEFVRDIKDSRAAFPKRPNTFGTLPTEAPAKIGIPKRILVCRPNHRLGNLLLVTPLIQEITNTFPECKIDLFVKGDLPSRVFKTYSNIENIIQLPYRPFPNFLKYIWSWLSIRRNAYDIVIDVDKNSSSGRISTMLADARQKVFGDSIQGLTSTNIEYHHHAKYPVYNFRNYLTKLGFQENRRPVPTVDLRLNAHEMNQGKKLLWQLVNNSNETIALFSYATGKKCYPTVWWDNIYERIKREFPHVNIIEILPINNVSKLSFKAPAFYSRDVREIGSVIANTTMFIGGDSGIMHLASAVHTPTIGLFSVTDHRLYAPYDNGSQGIDTNITTVDDLIKVIGNILRGSLTHRQLP